MNPRMARNQSDGVTPHARPNRYCCARCAVAGAWPSITRICSPYSGNAIIGSEISKPADAKRAPNQARVAGAERLRGKRGHGGHQSGAAMSGNHLALELTETLRLAV